jgi:hypothetical protein
MTSGLELDNAAEAYSAKALGSITAVSVTPRDAMIDDPAMFDVSLKDRTSASLWRHRSKIRSVRGWGHVVDEVRLVHRNRSCLGESEAVAGP